jgi:DNA-binding protein HU-beta
MNHADMVEKVAAVAEVSKVTAARAVEAVVQTIVNAAKAGEEVRVSGLGIFDISVREARPGRNPQTGATINIPASRSLRFRAGKAVKDELNPSGQDLIA